MYTFTYVSIDNVLCVDAPSIECLQIVCVWMVNITYQELTFDQVYFVIQATLSLSLLEWAGTISSPSYVAAQFVAAQTLIHLECTHCRV